MGTKHGGDGFRGDGFASGGHTPGREHPHKYKKGGHVENVDDEAEELDSEMTDHLAKGGNPKAHPGHAKPHMPHSPKSAHHTTSPKGAKVHSGHYHMKGK